MASSTRAASKEGNFIVTRKVTHFLKRQDSNQVLACARWLFNRFRGGNLAETIENFIVIAQLIRGLSDAETEVKASHLKNALAWHFAGAIPPTKKEFTSLEKMAEQTKLQIAGMRSGTSRQIIEQFTLHDLTRLRSAHIAMVSTVEMIRTQFQPGRHPYPLGLPDDIAAEADRVALRLAELQEYPVPQCVMQDGIFHDPELCWVFYDGPTVLHKMPEEFMSSLRTPLAYTLLAEKADIQTTLEPSMVSVEDKEHGIGFDFPYSAMITIQTDGTMTVDGKFGIYSLERAFQAAGYGEAYELFRLIHLLRLVDLVIPETVKRQRKIPDWPSIVGTTTAAHREHVENLFRRFYVPRQHVFYEPGLGASIRREVAASEKLTDENSSVRRQGGYLWPLPPGKSATPRARQLYRDEWGREIPEGQTYTSAHNHRYRDPQGIREARRRPRPTEE